MTGEEALAQAVARLRAAGVQGPARDARRLLADALAVGPEMLVVVLQEPLAGPVEARFTEHVCRRAARVPVAQIIGIREFWGRRFRVTSDVLDPRPETEMLVEVALEEAFTAVLDLGTGSGCILLTLLAERKGASGIGTDISGAALDVARSNALSLGLDAAATFIQADWLRGVSGNFDLIVSNPPYVAAADMSGLAPEVRLHEPRLALTDGGDGLSAYCEIAKAAPGLLATNGLLIVEIGSSQAEPVLRMLADAGLAELQVQRDLDGRQRVVSGRRR